MKAYRVMAGEAERWHARQAEAFAEALAHHEAGEEVEVDLCELRPGLGTLGALNRDRVVVRAHPIARERWLRRARRATAADRRPDEVERAERLAQRRAAREKARRERGEREGEAERGRRVVRVAGRVGVAKALQAERIEALADRMGDR